MESHCDGYDLEVPTYSYDRDWQQWHGTMEDMVTVATMAAEAIAEWSAKEPEIEVTLVEGERETAGITIADLGKLRPHELAGVTSVKVSVGRRWDPPGLTIRLGRPAPVLTMQLSATDPHRAEGLWTQMVSEFDRGSRRVRSWNRLAVLPVMGATAVGALFLYVGLLKLLQNVGWAGHGSTYLKGDWVLIGAMAVAVPSFWVLLYYLFPDLELLAPNERPRSKRFGAWIISAIVAFVLAVAGSLIVAAISH
jgi:hypothetical protein